MPNVSKIAGPLRVQSLLTSRDLCARARYNLPRLQRSTRLLLELASCSYSSAGFRLNSPRSGRPQTASRLRERMRWSTAPTDEFVGVWIPQGGGGGGGPPPPPPSRKKQRPTTRGCPIVAVSPVGDYVTANSDPASRLSKHGTVVVESAEVAIALRNEVDKENRTWQSAW